MTFSTNVRHQKSGDTGKDQQAEDAAAQIPIYDHGLDGSALVGAPLGCGLAHQFAADAVCGLRHESPLVRHTAENSVTSLGHNVTGCEQQIHHLIVVVQRIQHCLRGVLLSGRTVKPVKNRLINQFGRADQVTVGKLNHSVL